MSQVPRSPHADHAPSSTFPPAEPPRPPCGCDEDPVEGLRKMFVDYAQGRALAGGRDPASRPVFLRLHGVAHGTLQVKSDLPPELRVGVFGQSAEYPVWVRFSSDVQPGKPDLKGTVGIGLKLFGVDGQKLLPPDEKAATQDFILQNSDVFFVDTAKDMCEFTCQALNGLLDEYLKQHPVTGQILDDMGKTVDSVLGTSYWSGLPSRFGEGRYVKYKLEPEVTPAGEKPDYNDPFYLRGDLHARLKKGEARFRFLVQLQTDAEKMPLDRATVRWSETESVPIHVATLILPAQDAGERGSASYGDNLSFNPWHALAVHAPVGSIAEARKVVYAASAASRRNVNGVPLGEPVAPRPPSWQPDVPYPAALDTCIVRAAIHPAIGVARVGNSPDGFFVGPEVVLPRPDTADTYRDAEQALKRQAARFRIYGYNAAGAVVRELTADRADIRWTAHVANRKAAFYQWQMALDIPEAATVEVPLRNASLKGAARNTLVIDGGVRSVGGKSAGGSESRFQGTFMGVSVYLGELRTDEEGRLLFLGGHGVSASPTGSTIFNDKDPNGFINADGWYDDMSDGPVTAEVRIEGRSIPVESAWVLTAPPNYAPDVVGMRTLYDLLFDLYVQAGWLPAPDKISFRDDVYPILRRLSGLQWVNQGFATQFGHGGPNDFTDPASLAKLARDPKKDGYDLYSELRRQVLNSYRNPVPPDGNQLPWPWIYGDAMDVPAGSSPRQNSTITPTQYRILQMWASGQLEADPETPAVAYQSIDEVPLPQRPAMLDRAALEYCLADAFHPGCEVTWPARHLTMYSAPFRIRHRPAGAPDPNYGKTLDQKTALAVDGPVYAQGPGDLTRWMGLPWQADTAYCRSGYDTSYDPLAPTFWPARVPNHVLTARDYAVVVDPLQPRARRLEAFVKRTSWNKPLHGSTAEQMEQMVRIFGSMGLVEMRRGVEGDPELPEEMMVASFGPQVAQADEAETAVAATAEAPVVTAAHALRTTEVIRPHVPKTANFASDEEARSAPRPVRHAPKK